MRMRTKFDEGKQINLSQRGSWEGRCAGAGVRLNEGPTWAPDCLPILHQITSLLLMPPQLPRT